MVDAGVATPWVVIGNRLVAALAGGLVGGVAFGLLMQITDIMLMVAALVASESSIVGRVVHLTISMLLGVLYALVFWPWAGDVLPAAGLGVLYGWTWWVLGGLIIMPAWLGRDDLFFRFNTTAWQRGSRSGTSPARLVPSGRPRAASLSSPSRVSHAL